MRYLSLFILILIATGCNQNNELLTRYHEDGRAKPVVAIASMIDTSSFDAPWSLSEELTSMIVQKIGMNKKIFVVTKEDDVFSENPFGQDLTWLKSEFLDEEFIAFLELVEHETVPASKSKNATDTSTNLNMAVRLRIVDVRGQTPKIVLQELIKDSYFIPKTLLPTDYRVSTWGTQEFLRSPMGIAHTQLVQEIAVRINDYVLLAKSR